MDSPQISRLKVAIVCDWLVGIGGAERVVLELYKMFPSAPIYTSQYDSSKIDWFKDADIRTLWLQKLPISLKKFLPVLRARAFSHLDLSDYDLVISASGAEAKGIKTGPKTMHICYCYAPTHYYWSRYHEYMQNPGFGAFNWLARLGLKVLVGPLRKWDKKAAQKPNNLIAISSHIQKEIKRYYGRNSVVIHPPVDIERFRVKEIEATPRSGFIIVGRQAPYKRFDLAVVACTNLNLPLTVIGDGPEHNKLKAVAGPTIKFVQNANDSDVVSYFHSAEAFIFPGLDDFGIAPVEAMAAGTPVIAYKGGGALDYVIPGQTGLFFEEQNIDSLSQSLKSFNGQSFKSQVMKAQAENFSIKNFQVAIKREIASAVKPTSER